MQWKLKECYKFVEPIIAYSGPNNTFFHPGSNFNIASPGGRGVRGAPPEKMLKVKRMEKYFIAI